MQSAWPFVGRDVPLSEAERLVRVGTGVVVVGDAGIGKTAFGRELQARFGAAGWRTRMDLGRGGPDVERTEPPTGEHASLGVLLVVDDAHMLDDDSAEQVWGQAVDGSAVVVATVRSPAQLAASAGAWAVALNAAHDAMRYQVDGDLGAAADLVVAAAARVDGALPRCLADDARSRIAADATALEQVADRLAAIGATLAAVESGHHAARTLRTSGDKRRAARAPREHALRGVRGRPGAMGPRLQHQCSAHAARATGGVARRRRPGRCRDRG